MSEEEWPLAQERQRQAARAEQMRPEILALLKQIAPRVSAETLATACEEVVRSVLNYEICVRVEQDEPLKATRKKLRSMKQAFEKCRRALEPDIGSYGAYQHFRESQFNQQGSSGNAPELKRQLISAIAAVDTSLKILGKQPGHRANLNRVRLAAELGLTLGTTLGLRVVMKPDGELKSAKPGASANYSRLFRLVLELAGENSSDSLRYFMEKSWKYLREEGVLVSERFVSEGFPADIAYMDKIEKFDLKI